tara:strand:+ start:1963 stop:2223 length:261 start_codon:yes stop_codon:yes gene_type:complete
MIEKTKENIYKLRVEKEYIEEMKRLLARGATITIPEFGNFYLTVVDGRNKYKVNENIVFKHYPRVYFKPTPTFKYGLREQWSKINN